MVAVNTQGTTSASGSVASHGSGGADDRPEPPSVDVLALALESTQVPFAMCDARDLRIVWANAAFEQATGYDAAGARERQRRPVPPEVRRHGEMAALRARLQRGEPTTAELSIPRADDSLFRCKVHFSPVPHPGGGAPERWIVAFEDRTERLTHDAEQARIVEAERQERRSVNIIVQVSDLLMDVTDRVTPLHEIAALLRRTVVRWASFYVNDGGLRPLDAASDLRPPSGRGSRHGETRRADGGDEAHAPQDEVQQLLDGDKDRPVELVLDHAHPRASASHWLAERIARETSGDVTVGDVDGRQGRGGVMGGGRAFVLPVPGRRRVIGVLVVQPREPGELDEATTTVLELIARRVGLVLDNARLYDREHRLAETLQRAMLPQQAEVEGLDVWTYYAPNSENAQVGGDWYDVLQIAPDVVGVVIGDVVGHDVEAAAAMGQLRSVVRSYAYDVTLPGPVLERVDQLVAGMRIPRAAGLVLSTLHRDGEAWRLRWSRAGHLPVLHVREGQVTQLLGAGGPLVGFGGGQRDTAELVLAPGDVLVYHTDGLVERRDRDLREGLQALAQVVSAVTARDSAGIGEELLSRLADHPEDDVAVVVVRVPDPCDVAERGRSPRRRRWSLPSEAASVARARHAVVRTCHAWEMPDAANAELVVSELVANAVLHGFGHVSLQLYDTGDGLRIEVEDGNPAPPVSTDGHPGRVGGFGMQIVERLADWGWRQSSRGKVVWAKVRPGALPATGR